MKTPALHTIHSATISVRAGRAFTLVEVVVAVAVIGLLAVGSTQAMLSMNRQAMVNRVMTNARIVAQEQINSALTVEFAPAANPPVIPALLQVGTTISTVGIAADSTGTTTISGTMTRTVTAESNPLGVTMRRFACVVSYNYLGRNYSVALSTIRSPDIR